MCVLILYSLHYDSLIGGCWARRVGWFKCWKTTCGLPGFANHTNAAVASSVNQTKAGLTCRFFVFPVWLTGGEFWCFLVCGDVLIWFLNRGHLSPHACFLFFCSYLWTLFSSQRQNFFLCFFFFACLNALALGRCESSPWTAVRQIIYVAFSDVQLILFCFGLFEFA